VRQGFEGGRRVLNLTWLEPENVRCIPIVSKEGFDLPPERCILAALAIEEFVSRVGIDLARFEKNVGYSAVPRSVHLMTQLRSELAREPGFRDAPIGSNGPFRHSKMRSHLGLS